MKSVYLNINFPPNIALLDALPRSRVEFELSNCAQLDLTPFYGSRSLPTYSISIDFAPNEKVLY